MDSIYAGFENGAWLQVRRTNDLNEDQRARLRAPASADVVINLVRPTPGGDLPMRRIFQDRQSNEIGEVDLWKYGYDARTRPWYTQTMNLERAYVTEPYLSFSLGAPVITVSAPLRGKVAGVLAADLKLDTFSDFVQSQRPGPHGTVMIFDQMGSLIAHPDFAEFVSSAMTDPGQSKLPNIDRIKSGIVASVLRKATNVDVNEGTVRDEAGRNYLFRLTKFTLGEGYSARILLLAAQDDFVQSVRKLQLTGLILAIVASAAFIPMVWIFGNRMALSLKAITSQARKLQNLAEPDPAPVTSHIAEINELGNTVNLAQRAIWSFAHFIPKEIVRRVLDNHFHQPRRRQTGDHACLHRCPGLRHNCGVCRSRHTDAANVALLLRADGSLPRRGRHDRQIYRQRRHGILEALDPQPDHVARACRAALAAQAAGERLNAEFEAEDLKPFITRFGIHVGEAVVGNVGSSERMNYTALGNAVNLAARLEGLNKVVGTTILASEDVYLRVRDQFEFSAFDAVVAKGMSRETRIYGLVGVSA